MALAYDAVSNPVAAQGVTSQTWSHTCTGSNRGLVVSISSWRDGGTTVSNTTYAAVATVAEGSTQDGVDDRVTIRSQINPASGANNVVVSFAAAVECVVGAVSYTGADQSDLCDGYANAQGSGTAASVNVASATGNIVQDALVWFTGGTLSDGASQTRRWARNEGASATSGACSTEPGAATTTMSWGFTTFCDWNISGVNVRAASESSTAELSGASSLTFAPTGNLVGSASLSGATALSFAPTANLVGSAALSGETSLAFAPEADVTLVAFLSGSTGLTFDPSANLIGTASLAGSTSLTFSPEANLDIGGGDLSGSTSLSFAPVGDLTGWASLSGTSSLNFSPTGDLTGSAALSGSTTISFDPSGDLTADAPGDLSGSTSLTFSPSGTLTLIGEEDSGGFAFLVRFENERNRRERERRKREEDEEEARHLQDDTDRQIASFLHEQQRKDGERKELARLSDLVRSHKPSDALSGRARQAFAKAQAKQTAGALIALQKELDRQLEEEEMAVLMAIALDD